MNDYVWDEEEESQRGRLKRRLKRVKRRKQIQEGFRFESESLALRMRLVHIDHHVDTEEPCER